LHMYLRIFVYMCMYIRRYSYMVVGISLEVSI